MTAEGFCVLGAWHSLWHIKYPIILVKYNLVGWICDHLSDWWEIRSLNRTEKPNKLSFFEAGSWQTSSENGRAVKATFGFLIPLLAQLRIVNWGWDPGGRCIVMRGEGVGCSGIQWERDRDVATHSTMHRTAPTPSQQSKELPSPKCQWCRVWEILT